MTDDLDMDVVPPATDPVDYPVQEACRFSQSLIWQLQRQYYDRHGISAWGENRIPFSISTSPFIAGAYARLVAAALRDWGPQLDLSEPVYVVELGAGSGRLGFHFLRQMDAFYDDSPLRGVPLTYVLTDLVEKNITFWEQHPSLQPYVAAGRLDFARFDAIADSDLHLRHSGRVLRAGALKNPLIVLANYVLDSLPMDLFWVEGGQLYEVQAALVSSQPEPDLNDGTIIERLELVYDRLPVTTAYYGEAGADAILQFYRQTFEATMLTFPYQVLRCLHTLQQLAGGRLMLISADKGDHHLEDLAHEGAPPIALHDNGFSVQFNYHAVMAYLRGQGAAVFALPYRHASLDIMAAVLNAPATTETALAYHDHIILNNPDDNFTAMLGFEKKETFTALEVLAYIRYKRYDSHMFQLVYPMLTRLVPVLPAALIPELRRMVAQVWHHYYHLNERYNLPFCLGVLLAAIRDYAGALPFFQQSITWYGETPMALFNISLCQHNVGDHAAALATFERIPAEFAAGPEVQDLKQRLLAAQS
ncbi:MAG: tetratricopeptide repeat protein [Anaerolineae bacterium]|jgi:hypothetical protein|nr:tetratricopeptide repeat protein [Anaerolineae bacterium]